MCLATPCRVIHADSDRIEVDWNGELLQVSALGLPDLRPGEYVLVHAGQVLDRVSEEEAEQILAIFARLEPPDSPAHSEEFPT